MEKRLKPAQNVLEQPRKTMANLNTSLWECFFIIGGCMNKTKSEKESLIALKLYVESYANSVALGVEHSKSEKEYTENKCEQILNDCPTCIFYQPKTTNSIFRTAMDLKFDKVVHKIGKIITTLNKKSKTNVTKEMAIS